MIKKGGITRNKLSALKDIKLSQERKKTRFQAFYKDLDDGQSTDRHILIELPTINAISTTTTIMTDTEKGIHSLEYQRAKTSLSLISQIQSKIRLEARNRLMTFKDSQIKRLDEKINQLSNSAMDHISVAEKILIWLRSSKSENEVEQKFIRNMERSLAFDIREATKSLRVQQKQFFDDIKNYERQSSNPTLQLTEAQKQSLKDEMNQIQLYQQLQKQRDQQINKLVGNINKLSSIYKQMNQLVIDQGSLIDRIDYNIEETIKHTKKGVQHLVKAEEHINSPFADRVIKVMVGMILMLALLLAYKYSK